MALNFKLDSISSRYLALAVLILLMMAAGSSSATSPCVNGRCMVEVSTSPQALPCGIAIAFLALFWPRSGTKKGTEHPVVILRRIGAFFFDFMVVLYALTPLLNMAMLAVEAEATGSFAWSFSRDYSRPSDAQLMFPGIFLIQFLLILYFYLHMALNHQTIGKYIFGYTIDPVEGKQPSYVAATILSVIGMGIWPISLGLALRRQDKAFLWDRSSNTNAVRVI